MFTAALRPLFEFHGAKIPPPISKEQLKAAIQQLLPIKLKHKLSPGGSAVTAAVVKRPAS